MQPNYLFVEDKIKYLAENQRGQGLCITDIVNNTVGALTHEEVIRARNVCKNKKNIGSISSSRIIEVLNKFA